MSLRVINNILAFVVIIIGLYLVLSPFIPDLLYKIRKVSQNTKIQAQTSKLNQPPIESDIPSDNRLQIPKLSLDERIYEGRSINLISKGGTWLRPSTANPSESGNSVIVGHRFNYNRPATFYNLDKLVFKDKIAVFWEKKRYIYEVYEVLTVSPSDVSIEASTDKPGLTLYTCTPLWTARQRLVIKTRLVEE